MHPHGSFQDEFRYGIESILAYIVSKLLQEFYFQFESRLNSDVERSSTDLLGVLSSYMLLLPRNSPHRVPPPEYPHIHTYIVYSSLLYQEEKIIISILHTRLEHYAHPSPYRSSCQRNCTSFFKYIHDDCSSSFLTSEFHLYRRILHGFQQWIQQWIQQWF